MVTGRDLIIYILKHSLEDDPVFENGRFVGFLTEGETAVKLDVGVATVRALVDKGIIEPVNVNQGTYIWEDSIRRL